MFSIANQQNPGVVKNKGHLEKNLHFESVELAFYKNVFDWAWLLYKKQNKRIYEKKYPGLLSRSYEAGYRLNYFIIDFL